MQFGKAEDKYGRTALAAPGQPVTMPTFKEVTKILGRSDGNNGEEEGGWGRVGGVV